MMTTELMGAFALALSAFAGECGTVRVEMALEWPATALPAGNRHRLIAEREAEAIWRRLGVVVQWAADAPDQEPTHRVTVLVTDDLTRRPDRPLPHLGWIEFKGDSPADVFHVSAPAALRAAHAARTTERLMDHLPLAAIRIVAARLVGRAIAHELGHYLLRSRRHTPNGLMRLVFPAYEGMVPLLDRYRLEPQQLAGLRARPGADECR